MISELKFIEEAKQHQVELAAIKAVAEVEGNGNGFINGRPVILFEPHIFWRELVKRKIDPYQYVIKLEPVKNAKGVTISHRQVANPEWTDMLYRTWGEKPYPKGQDAQYKRLERAVTINRDAALSSCSWGAFQILGNNWEACGCSSLQDFINKIYSGDDAHLDLFTEYIRETGLVKYLRTKNWAKFAEGYNGKYYFKHNYDGKLAAAFLKFSQ